MIFHIWYTTFVHLCIMNYALFGNNLLAFLILTVYRLNTAVTRNVKMYMNL